MGRSIKKGPYADFRLLKKVETTEKSGKKISDQDMVEKINDHSGDDQPHIRCSQWK